MPETITIAVTGADSSSKQTALHNAMQLLDRHLRKRKLRPAGDATWSTSEARPGRYVTRATVRAVPKS